MLAPTPLTPLMALVLLMFCCRLANRYYSAELRCRQSSRWGCPIFTGYLQFVVNFCCQSVVSPNYHSFGCLSLSLCVCVCVHHMTYTQYALRLWWTRGHFPRASLLSSFCRLSRPTTCCTKSNSISSSTNHTHTHTFYIYYVYVTYAVEIWLGVLFAFATLFIYHICIFHKLQI